MAGDIFDRILRPLRRRVVTSRYPDVPPLLPTAARGLPELDVVRCDGTGACVAACPTGAITQAAGTWALDVGACITCGDCARACPQQAIELGPRIELAVIDPRDLRVTRVIQGRS